MSTQISSLKDPMSIIQHFINRHVLLIPIFVDNTEVRLVVIDHFTLIPSSWPIRRIIEVLLERKPNETRN
jgi:hypothetical protein